jgi:Rad3-related DNA helicases
MDIFPYSPRGPQQDIVEFIRTVTDSGGTAVLESGTGTGKTICSLAGALQSTLNTGKRLVYITRTKSQQKQVIHEVRQISKKRNVACIGVQGRNVSTCPFMKDDPELTSGTPEELSRLCSDLKKRKTDGCRFYRQMDPDEVQEHLEFLRKEHPNPEEFIAYAAEMQCCPYELMKRLVEYADVIVIPYTFMLMPNIRQHFLNWMNADLSDIVLIVDEAHNIPDYLREVMTCRYSEYGLNMMEKEAKEWEDPDIHNGVKATDLASAFHECISEAVSEYLNEDDGLIPPYFLEEGLMSSLSVSSVSLNKMYRSLTDLGEIVAERKRMNRKLPRSYMGSFGRFLHLWSECSEEMYVKLITAPPNPAFESYCMDPYPAAEPFRVCSASIHMSGTLEPLSEYSDMLGLNAEKRTFSSPFDPANLLTIYSEDVSTKFDDIVADKDMIKKLENMTMETVLAENRNAAVFFPSYVMMDNFISDGVVERLGKNVFFERKGSGQQELMDEINKFRTSENGVLFAVSGGRVSEGLDFPDRDLEVAVLVGIPYPKPNAKLSALTRYCDLRYGKGWERAVRSPTIRKMRQTIGRLIRSETDRGVAVILDKRAAMIKELNARAAEDLACELQSFFSK